MTGAAFLQLQFALLVSVLSGLCCYKVLFELTNDTVWKCAVLTPPPTTIRPDLAGVFTTAQKRRRTKGYTRT